MIFQEPQEGEEKSFPVVSPVKKLWVTDESSVRRNTNTFSGTGGKACFLSQRKTPFDGTVFSHQSYCKEVVAMLICLVFLRKEPAGRKSRSSFLLCLLCFPSWFFLFFFYFFQEKASLVPFSCVLSVKCFFLIRESGYF